MDVRKFISGKRQPRIAMGDIPAFFRGGLDDRSESESDRQFGEAVAALVALTGRPDDDPAVRVVLAQIEETKASLLSDACAFGRCIPDGQPHGIDEWDDDVLEAVTGYRRKSQANSPDPTSSGQK
jgi:hypothetical protein